MLKFMEKISNSLECLNAYQRARKRFYSDSYSDPAQPKESSDSEYVSQLFQDNTVRPTVSDRANYWLEELEYMTEEKKRVKHQ